MMRRRMLSAGITATVLGWAASANAQPAYEGYLDSELYPIRVHYSTGAGVANGEIVLRGTVDTDV